MAVGLRGADLVFEFPEVHPDAVLRISFHRTLRIPDDDRTYNLPPSLGRFRPKDVDDIPADRIPAHWPRRGGVVIPMWQAEAMWLSFAAPEGYPFAVMIAAGKVNAVTGRPWAEPLDHRTQNFVQIPKQPWLDGFCVRKGLIRQFVAMPLGEGYTVEEQVTGAAEHGGVQILVHPLEAGAWERMKRERAARSDDIEYAVFCRRAAPVYAELDMGLGAGGRMKQEIYASDIPAGEWSEAKSKCFVAIANSLSWVHLTGENPPHPAPTAADYTARGLPWFDFYADGPVLEGSDVLGRVSSVKQIGAQKGAAPLPENTSFDPKWARLIRLGRRLLPRTKARALPEREF